MYKKKARTKIESKLSKDNESASCYQEKNKKKWGEKQMFHTETHNAHIHIQSNTYPQLLDSIASK